MIDDGKGTVVAKDADEAFWIDTKEKCTEALATEKRNIAINEQIIALCEKKLEAYS